MSKRAEVVDKINQVYEIRITHFLWLGIVMYPMIVCEVVIAMVVMNEIFFWLPQNGYCPSSMTSGVSHLPDGLQALWYLIIFAALATVAFLTLSMAYTHRIHRYYLAKRLSTASIPITASH